MMMNKFLSNKIHLRIIIVVLLLLIGNTFFENKKIKEYAYERMFSDFERSIINLEKMNDTIAEICLTNVLNKEDYEIDDDAIFKLVITDYEIREMMNIDKGAFRWRNLRDISYNTRIILDDKILDEAEENYLKTVHSYNLALIDLYDKVLKEHGKSRYSIIHSKDEGKDIYKEFCKRASKITQLKKYKTMIDYSPNTEDNEKIVYEENIAIEEAKETANKIFQRIFPQDELIDDEKNKEKGREAYIFHNKLSTKDENKTYEIEVDKTDGSMGIRKRVQFHNKDQFKEDQIEKKAKEIAGLFIDGDYVCYKKEKSYDDDDHKIDKIHYNFIKKVGDVYDETQVFEISVNRFGELYEIYISNPLKDKIEPIINPKQTIESILSNVKKGNIENCILIRNGNGKLEYEVFIRLNDILYSHIFDANSGENKDFEKSKRVYFKRISI